MFTLDPVYQARLDALKSSYRLSSRTPTYKKVNGELEVDQPAQIICKVVDLLTNTVYAQSVVTTGVEEDAVIAAIEVAEQAEKPKTPSQLVTENVELKRRLAEYEAQAEPAGKSGKKT
jgi:hypothetical protein